MLQFKRFILITSFTYIISVFYTFALVGINKNNSFKKIYKGEGVANVESVKTLDGRTEKC